MPYARSGQNRLGEYAVNQLEISQVQTYLRAKFGNETISLSTKGRPDDSAEVSVGGEFIGLVYRDEDEGEVSFAFHMAIIDKDLTA